MYGLDLFSGVGGITKALEGYVWPVAYCENDRYAQGVLLSRMSSGALPLAPIWDDIRTLNAQVLGPCIDILYGGFPCQDISLAGRGAGLAGERSGLFFEIARLVSEIRPQFVFLENVPAINRRGGDVVVGTLADLGYDCRWDVLSAADVGANHKRERWFLLAHSKLSERRPGDSTVGDLVGKIGLSSGREEVTGGFGIGGKNVADTEGSISERLGTEPSREPGRSSDPRWWDIEPNVGRVAHGISQRVDRLRALGNAVVPAQAREAFERLIGLKVVSHGE